MLVLSELLANIMLILYTINEISVLNLYDKTQNNSCIYLKNVRKKDKEIRNGHIKRN